MAQAFNIFEDATAVPRWSQLAVGNASAMLESEMATGSTPISTITPALVRMAHDCLFDPNPKHGFFVDEAMQHRMAVQKALHDYLDYLIVDGDAATIWSSPNVFPLVETAIVEAAYSLLQYLRQTGAMYSLEITSFAIADLLCQFREKKGPESSTAQEAAAQDMAKPSFQCTHPGCNQKAFNRQADLDRHTANVHAPDTRKQLLCDYKKCTRHTQPFFRKDHLRDHLLDFHKEDLPRRTATQYDAEWWNTRAPRAIRSGWWRCNQCLTVRVNIEKHGYVCPSCKGGCEEVRRKFREES